MSNEILIFITEIAIPFVFSMFTIYVAPKVNNFVTEQQLNNAVKIAVEGVEQYMTTDEGLDKKLAVFNYVQSQFKIDDDQLNILIEAYVYEMNKTN